MLTREAILLSIDNSDIAKIILSLYIESVITTIKSWLLAQSDMIITSVIMTQKTPEFALSCSHCHKTCNLSIDIVEVSFRYRYNDSDKLYVMIFPYSFHLACYKQKFNNL